MIDSIKQYETAPGPNLSTLDHVLTTTLSDFNITATDSQKEAFKSSIQVKYIQAIVRELQDRFPDVNGLDAFSAFDLQGISTTSDELAVYGQEKIDISKKPMEEIILMWTVLNV